MHVVAEAQRNGGICAYIDAEHAMDPVYARAIGVDVDELLISQPDTGEQALEIADMLVRSGALDVVVIDSVAALTPRAEIEGEMGDTHVGLQARLMSQALRKLTANLNKSNTIVIFINQLREKIGVMFGCCPTAPASRSPTARRRRSARSSTRSCRSRCCRTTSSSGELVAEADHQLVRQRRRRALPAVHRRPAAAATAGRSSPRRENHLDLDARRLARAGELVVGDRVLQSVPHHLSRLPVGGRARRPDGRRRAVADPIGHGARFRWGHGAKQAEYGDWKASLFANVGVSRSTNAKGAVFHDVQPLPELAELREAVYVGGKKVLSDDYLKQLTPLSLAIWYMDDGGFTLRSKGLQERTEGGSGRSEICVEAMSPDTRDPAARLPRRHLGHRRASSSRSGAAQGGAAVPDGRDGEAARAHRAVRPSVDGVQAAAAVPRPVRASSRCSRRCGSELMPMPITSITVEAADAQHAPLRHRGRGHAQLLRRRRDGAQLAGDHPGGRALKFYSSVRLDIRRIESIKDGAEVVGNRTRVKVVKNKVRTAVPAGRVRHHVRQGHQP